MPISGVFMTDTDGNLGSRIPVSVDSVCGLLFDISAQSDFWTAGAGLAAKDKLQNTVVELNCLDDAKKVGITPFTDGGAKDLLMGIPYYHIQQFFGIAGGSGRLFVAFADCKSDWNALIDMQKASGGSISQFGVWTEQSLWHKPASDYTIQLVGALNGVATSMANDYHAPTCILLNANTSKVSTDSVAETTVTWSKIPTCKVQSRYVAVLLGQACDNTVGVMQGKLASTTPVGCVGAALGCLARASVAESIGWVDKFDLAAFIPDVEMGFGDATKKSDKITNATVFSSLTKAQIEHIDQMGYIYLTKYPGYAGHVFFSGDSTCDDGDFRAICYNRVINKSRRLIRQALLPYVNAPLQIAPSTGQLSAAQITIFYNTVDDILKAMASAKEINGGKPYIDNNQNVLLDDTLRIEYKIVPMGINKTILVSEGLALKV